MQDTKIKVEIPEGASLNEEEQPQGFPEEVFSRLPEPLREACLEVLTEPQEREAFLVGALGVLSGILPKVQGFYDASFTGPNLYCYVLAAYGTGKGFLK